ncbi:hypothetical protein EXIGLDRAFT_770863 [Exidia glandulosa HHB12029]|uniref:Secreted protein n=1 Tax=Exidia glandulosa HHB12029 TaxID=1314781 RepID=A0A165GDL8_EXIGL|nr:hypothetical protein EXIGLDRAFT_770863 [Exidia glandulosa HHB12029]
MHTVLLALKVRGLLCLPHASTALNRRICIVPAENVRHVANTIAGLTSHTYVASWMLYDRPVPINRGTSPLCALKAAPAVAQTRLAHAPPCAKALV